MFSSLVWLRAFSFFLLFLTTLTNAREEVLYTSSVTYCDPPETLLIQRFEVSYFPSNRSVSFNVSAASVQPNVSVTANLFLNVYGMKPVNVTLDLCTILKGALCPLPMYNFTGADSIILPESLNVVNSIPGIAYKIPDLEGFAQLTLTEVGTGATKACVQATLANGWSAFQPAVGWTTGGITIAAVLASIFLSYWAADALAPFRFLELMHLFQTIACSALLNLNYPAVYRAFALNFAWAIGLFPMSASSSIQRSINNMRHHTGGSLADSNGGSAIQYVNRKLSPYNDNRASEMLAFPSIPTYVRRELSQLGSLIKRQTVQGGEVQTVTTSSSNVLQAGLPIYVNSVHISTANAFMTVFLVALMMFAIGLALLALGYGIHHVLQRRMERNIDDTSDSKFNYVYFARAWILRLGLITFGPWLTFIFYQWTLKDSWLSILLSVLSFIFIISLIGVSAFFVIRIARREDPFALYTPGTKHLAIDGPLYAEYRPPRYHFLIFVITASFLRAFFIAFAKYSAQAQIALMIVLEGLFIIALIVFKPYRTRGRDIFAVYLAVVRFVCGGLMIAFLQSINVSPIPRVVIGIVIALIFAVSVVVVIINFVLHAGLLQLWHLLRNKRTTTSVDGSQDSQEGSMLEKGIKKSRSGGLSDSDRSNSGEELSSSEVRPHNPTPDQSTPIDNSFLHPFPISPTGTTVTSITDIPSLNTRDSGTLTVGSLLPRRWSFSYSQPNSPTGSSLGHGIESYHTPDSMHFVLSSSPTSWRPGSSSSSSNGHVTVTRSSSVKALQQYQQNHGNIPEHESL